MAWELTWPLAVIDIAFVFVIHGWFETEGETWDSIWALASFFTVSPWVIRRALRREYGGRTVTVVRADSVGDTLDYQESLKVMWLLAWRTLALSLAGLLVVSLVLKLLGIPSHSFTTESPLANNLGLSLADVVSSLLFVPFLIPGMLKKRFRSFHLDLTVPKRHKKR